MTAPAGAAPADPAAGAAAFGRWLTRERELRGLGRDEVTRATRLAAGMVEALESGDRDRLPARAYAVGYLRTYAAAVGLDPDEVVLRFEEAAGAVPSEVGARRALRGPWLAVGAALAAAVAAAVWAFLP